ALDSRLHSLHRLTGRDALQQRPGNRELLIINCMRHSRIPPQLDLRSHFLEDCRRLLHALEGNMWIRVAGTQKSGRASERAAVISWSARRADQTAGECDDSAIGAR